MLTPAAQLVITEKNSQARDVRAAVGNRYGQILPAEGHLFDLQGPEEVVPVWQRWAAVLLRPDALYGTRPALGGNKAAKLKAIGEALRNARRLRIRAARDVCAGRGKGRGDVELRLRDRVEQRRRDR